MKGILAMALAFSATPAWAGVLDLNSSVTKEFLLGTVPTGCQPKGMKLDATGNFIYLAEMCGRTDPQTGRRVPTAAIYDLPTRQLKKVLITPRGETKGIFANTEVEFSRDGRWAFIARAEGDAQSEVFKNTGLLTVVNTQTQNIVKYIPLKGSGSKIVAARPQISATDPQILYVANYFSDDLSVVDISALREDGSLDGTSYFKEKVRLTSHFKNPRSRAYFIAPRGIAFSRDGRYALVLASETGSILVVDAVRHKQIAELPPLPSALAGREINVRHIVVSNDGSKAYLTHMRGNAISQIDMDKFISEVRRQAVGDKITLLPSRLWDEILIPFGGPNGRKIMVLEAYPKDHPNFPSGRWGLAHPNNAVLDPVKNRYLFVSSRTTTTEGDVKINPRLKGKIDIVDLQQGRIVFTLVGGSQPTALEISKDGNTLISSGFIDEKLYFFDVGRLLRLYEKP